MSVADERLLEKVARGLSEPWTGGGRAAQGSILTVSAGVYGARPVTDETTIPTGFDPHAAALFEAIVEAAYLVATAAGCQLVAACDLAIWRIISYGSNLQTHRRKHSPQRRLGR